MGKQILIFVNGELFKHLTYRTKKEAKGNYRIFLKNGYCNYITGETIQGLTFELI